MSVSIRTTMSDGDKKTVLYATEAEGLRVLDAMLDLHRKRGNTVRLEGTIYVVTDNNGKVIQMAEIISSV